MATTATRRKKPISAAEKQRKREAAKQRADDLHTRLTEQVEALASSEEWTRYLQTMQSFRQYSFHNLMLIMRQFPTATQVAGYQQWLKLGRQVRAGETSIKIFGYSTKKYTVEDSDGNEQEKRRTIYPVLSVFDISQTEGDPLPEISHELSGEDEAGIYDRVEAWLKSDGWNIERGDTGTARGYTSAKTRTVRISDTLTGAGAAKTMLHEAAHVVLHETLDLGEYQEHRGVYEVEAESVAYVVAGMLGMDTSDLSVGYVAGWADGDAEVLQTTAKNVHRAVHVLHEALSDDEHEEPEE
jgi:antirestriction protein ArdC